jgi:hypothetical protein
LQAPRAEGLIGIAIIFAVEVVILSLLSSISSTRYVLTDDELVVKASMLVGGTQRVPLKTIKSVQRTLIPFGLRLFGASFYGGYYYFPSVGRVFMIMTNFKDGVLIKAERENYVITPKDPDNFIEEIKKARESLG